MELQTKGKALRGGAHSVGRAHSEAQLVVYSLWSPSVLAARLPSTVCRWPVAARLPSTVCRWPVAAQKK
ncbi:hypothetical protein DFA_07100 [Cavenderia fasciculata]|uniref:Uncharacterized protein n=1 Tax=Cavenderia fasciculata TaxID=261658 RepID=F4PVH2_CACFS|nr:uncharacterized protein DFA_07100 [Cavenderia fasciculata]EGG19986.1 hypothetical protein DFA_07100 [Cavenderia fasciculata]|eukprot:XP_004366969.1 hypothetical protein DFA_07100 [Cavenderia fasciculata]